MPLHCECRLFYVIHQLRLCANVTGKITVLLRFIREGFYREDVSASITIEIKSSCMDYERYDALHRQIIDGSRALFPGADTATFLTAVLPADGEAAIAPPLAEIRPMERANEPIIHFLFIRNSSFFI